MTDFDPHLRRLMTLANRRARDEAANLATQATQASDIQLQAHTERTDNPHSVTAVQAGAEPALGNPPSDGYVLSSTAAGVRSWANPAIGVPWHGHLHRPTESVTLPSHYSLWLARLEVTSGIVVTVESGAVLRLG